MRTVRMVVAAVGVAIVCVPLTLVPVSAHHAFAAEFDANQPISIRGTVAKVEWVNPHSWVHVDVKNPELGPC